MYCKNCGKRVNEGERFCASCGAPLAGDSADETAHLDPDETVIAYPESTAPASTDDTDIIYHAAPSTAARLDDTLITHPDDTLLVSSPVASEASADAELADAAAHEADAAPQSLESEDEDEVGDAAFAPKEGNYMPTVAILDGLFGERRDDGRFGWCGQAAVCQAQGAQAAHHRHRHRGDCRRGGAPRRFRLRKPGLPEPTSTVVNVRFSIDAPGYDSKDSALPVEVTGTTSGGSAYDQDFFIDPGGNGVQLAPGSYSLAVKASPLLDDGNLYAVPSGTLSFEIAQAVQDGATSRCPTARSR